MAAKSLAKSEACDADRTPLYPGVASEWPLSAALARHQPKIRMGAFQRNSGRGLHGQGISAVLRRSALPHPRQRPSRADHRGSTHFWRQTAVFLSEGISQVMITDGFSSAFPSTCLPPVVARVVPVDDGLSKYTQGQGRLSAAFLRRNERKCRLCASSSNSNSS